MSERIFINRRRRQRRQEKDPCSDLPMDLYHRKRRKSVERRQPRALAEDYHAFMGIRFESTEESSTE